LIKSGKREKEHKLREAEDGVNRWESEKTGRTIKMLINILL
jgi:hypothetical protein